MRKPLAAVFVAMLAAPLAQAATQRHFCTQSSITVNESEGFVSIEMKRQRNLSEPSVGALVVYGSWQWFLPHGIHYMEFAPFQSRKTIRLPIDDDWYVGTQTTTVRCGGMNGNVPAPHESEVALTVLEDEAPPKLIAPAVFEVTETEDRQVVEIPLSVDTRFGRGGHVSVQADRLSSNFSAGRSVLFDPDESTDVLRVTIPGNSIAEEDQDVLLTLAGDVPATQILLRIVDDDRRTFDLTFDQQSYSFDEATPSFVTITRSRDLSAAFDVQVRASGRGWSSTLVQVSFIGGEISKKVELAVNDSVHMGERIGTIDMVVAGTVLATVPVTIRDDDPVPVLSIRSRSIFEGIEGQNRPVRFTLALTHALGVPLRVKLATAHGTTDHADYEPLRAVFEIPAFWTEYDAIVFVRGDDVLEPDETFTLSITEIESGSATIGVGTATGTIVNDDELEPPSTYRFEQLPTEWNESQKWLTATIVRANRLDRASVVTARLAMQSGGRAHSLTSVDFAPNETRKEVRFFIDDRFYTTLPAAVIRLTSTRGEEDHRLLTIAENEPVPVISIEDLEVTEGATERHAAFRINVEPPTDQPLDVRFVTPIGSDDFREMNEHITIAPFRSGGLSVSIIGDDIPEQTESFPIAITELSLPYVVRGKTEATFTIHDDDVAGARLFLASDRIARGASTTVTLQLDAPAPMADVIRLSSAIPGDLGMPETVAIAAGATSVAFDVTGLRAGVDVLRVDLPSWLGNARLEATLLVYSLSLPVLPDMVRIPLGDTVSVTIGLAPPSDHDARATLATLDRAIAEVDSFVLIADGGTGTFEVYGGKVGRTMIEIRLPAEVGGTVINLPVEVY